MNFLASYTQFVEQHLEDVQLPASPSNLYDPLRYFLQIGGKRMRPILVLLGAELFGKSKEDAIHAALAVELFHNFTLIHDDIMDNAPVRRTQATVHTKWNTNIAILSGDALFVKAYEELAKQKEVIAELMQIFNKTALEVCEGQQMDMDFEDRSDVTSEEYIEMVRLKTSVLLGCALEMGAIVANASKEDAEHIYSFGENIGIAFQIQDDILDLYADPDKFGKQVGGDVLANKKTLLNLLAKENANTQQLEIIRQLEQLEQPLIKVERTKMLYDQLNVKQLCEGRMEHYHQKALQALNQLSIDEQKRDVLKELAKFILTREN